MLLLEINGRGSDGWEWKKRNMDGDALKNLNRDGLIINTPRERPPVHSSTSSPGGIRSQERWSFLLLYWKTSSLRKDRITWAQPSVYFFSLCGSSIMNVKRNVMHRMLHMGDRWEKGIKCRLHGIYCRRNESATIYYIINPKETSVIPTIIFFYSFPEDVEARPNIADEKPCRHGVTAVIDILFIVHLRKSWALIRSQPVAQGFSGFQLLQSQRNVAPSEFSLSFN